DYHSIHLQEPVVDFPCEGKETFIDQIFKVIADHKPLTFKLVGFPFKSINTEQKVISSQPDMAERSALEHLNELCSQIQSLYSPGAHIVILTDGHIFCDVFQVSDAEVETYETTLKALASDLPHVTIQTLADLLPKDIDYQALREKFDHLSASEIDQKSLDLMKERLAFELNGIDSNLDHLAKTMMQRSHHYASFLLKQPSLAPMISLSVHFQKNIARKMGIYLVGKSPITPWHGAFVTAADGSVSIQYKKDINDQDYQVVSKIVNGVPCAFYRHR
ncbi:MAG TPA: L-tyrosine/L-tryptophan isonitrile synthase family protein, partial [Candidatus Nitrosotenuis sp.]|nr:L-tyrosine/L-tryptophan isonitrile synthase family protein [Candidatus Nitrosotenuis sp.]